MERVDHAESEGIHALMPYILLGIWAMEIAAECSESTTFTLLDYDSSFCELAYPHHQPNIHLKPFSLPDDFVKYPEWKNTFDLVHQRLMMLAFTPVQWRQVLQHYFDVLKPGGYIQLFEFDADHRKLGPLYMWAAGKSKELAKKRNIDVQIAGKLSGMLAECGYQMLIKE